MKVDTCVFITLGSLCLEFKFITDHTIYGLHHSGLDVSFSIFFSLIFSVSEFVNQVIDKQKHEKHNKLS